jgi:hypothetical protein
MRRSFLALCHLALQSHTAISCAGTVNEDAHCSTVINAGATPQTQSQTAKEEEE